jgi:hypothetical protein
MIVTHDFEYDQVLGIKRYIPAETSLVEQVLCDEYYTDMPVMATIVKVITHVPRIGLDQDIVQHN